MTSNQQRAALQRQIWQIAMHKQTSVNKIYDPACGSGSLLLQSKKHFDAHIINVLTDKHIEQIIQVFDSKDNAEHFAQSVDNDKIAENDYNLSVSSYVEAKDNREVIDIAKLNAELKTTVAKIDQLRSDIDTIVAEIEGGDQ